MADPKTIAQLTERSGALQATDDIECQVSGETSTKKKALSAVRTFVLGGATIGGNAAGDILTTNGTQTSTNKTFTSPRLNSPTLNDATSIIVTGAHVNTLSGNTYVVKTKFDELIAAIAANTDKISLATKTEIGMLSGVTSAIQTQLNALSAQIPSPTGMVSTYSLTFATGAGETTKQISQATLIAPEVEGNYGIDPASIVVSLFISDGGNKRSMLSIGRSTDDAQFEVNTKIVSGLTQVDFVRFSDLTAETTYSISLHFKLIGQIN